jgi:hypothetical protein
LALFDSGASDRICQSPGSFGLCARATIGHAAALPNPAMNSRRLISALQRFVGKPIAIRDALEPVLMGPCGASRSSPHVGLGIVARLDQGVGTIDV